MRLNTTKHWKSDPGRVQEGYHPAGIFIVLGGILFATLFMNRVVVHDLQIKWTESFARSSYIERCAWTQAMPLRTSPASSNAWHQTSRINRMCLLILLLLESPVSVAHLYALFSLFSLALPVTVQFHQYIDDGHQRNFYLSTRAAFWARNSGSSFFLYELGYLTLTIEIWRAKFEQWVSPDFSNK